VAIAATVTAPLSRSRIAGRAAAVVAALVVLALLLQPWWLAPLMSHRLSASAQRQVHFDSMWVTLTGALKPAVHFRGIRIENAPWADRSRPFADLEAATAVFSWRSVREQRPVIEVLVLRGGQIDFERRADGLRNWRLRRPDDRGPGRFKVLSIRGENASARFLHEGLELDLEAKATANVNEAGSAGAAGGEALPTRLAIRGTWRGAPFAIDAATSEALTFLETGRAFTARGQATSGGARLDFDGQLGDIVRDPIFDARVALTAPSLAPFAPVLGRHRPEAKGIAVAGGLKGAPGHYALSIAKGRLGATDVAGELSWTRGEARDLVRARLTSESAHLADLRALAGRRSTPVERVAAAASASARSTSSPPGSRPAPASTPVSSMPASAASAGAASSGSAPTRPVDSELSFAARRLRGEGMPWLQSARVEAALADGRLTVSSFDVGIAQGHAVGKGRIDTASSPRRGNLEVDVRGVRIESFLPVQAANSLLSGALNGRAVLDASGDSAEALLASVTGKLDAAVSGGTISSLLDAKIGLQGGKVVRGLLTGAEPLPIRCAAAALDFARGSARIRSLVLDTERTRTQGTGAVDLVHQTIDVVLTPEAKEPGLFVLERSIRLHGPLRQPAHALVARAPPVTAGPAARCAPS